MSKHVNSTPVSKQIPFDNTTTGATGLASKDVQLVIEELNQKVQGATGNVTPPFLFSRQGSTGLNSYLQVGNVFSNQAGQIIPGNNKIVGLTLTTSQAYNANQTIQIQRRTGVATFVDIATCAITITGNNTNYSAAIVFSTPITIGPGWELAAYLKSGNNVANAVLLVYVVPA